MALSQQTFSQFLSNAKTIVQGSASGLVDFSQGSISLALMRAVSALALWFQGVVLQLAALTRLTTSSGADVDSWLQQFGAFRAPAVSAQGTVTFSRFTNTLQALIPAGTIVQTADGSQQFIVIADTTQSAWNATLNAYVIPGGTSSANATAQAIVPGIAGNVASSMIAQLSQSIVFVDTVTNASAFTGGAEAATDAQAKASFQPYIASLTQGTKQACINAVASIQTGAVCYITENQTIDGVTQNGYFYAICDDGTGSPSGGFLSACYTAIDKVRAIATPFGVFAPQTIGATVSLKLVIAPGYTGSTLIASVTAAITAYINSLGIGATLPYTRLAQIAYDVSPGIINVENVLLNTGTADVTSSISQIPRAGVITVTT